MELQKKSDKDLIKLLKEKRKSLLDFSFSKATGQGNVREGRVIRKDIARILTEMRARQNKGETQNA